MSDDEKIIESETVREGADGWRSVFEANYASCHLAEFEPHVSGPFLAEMRAEAERRDVATREAHDAYVASCERDAQTNDPGDLG